MNGRETVNSCIGRLMHKAASSLEMVLLGELLWHQWSWLLDATPPTPGWLPCYLSSPRYPLPSFQLLNLYIGNLDTHWVGNYIHANLFLPDIQGLSITLRIYQSSVVGKRASLLLQFCMSVDSAGAWMEPWLFCARRSMGHLRPGLPVSVARDTLRSFPCSPRMASCSVESHFPYECGWLPN